MSDGGPNPRLPCLRREKARGGSTFLDKWGRDGLVPLWPGPSLPLPADRGEGPGTPAGTPAPTPGSRMGSWTRGQQVDTQRAGRSSS